jgi:hypothetical protein
MAGFSKHLDSYQGYNFKKDKQAPVGFITKLKIGDTELGADQTCKDPTNPTQDLKAVAVLNTALWETGLTDAVYLSGQVSTANKQEIAVLVLNDLIKIDVTFQFSVYDYDPVAQKYYLAFHSNSTDLTGVLEKRGGADLHLEVADEPSREVQSPENYTVSVGVKPQPSAQTIHLATADQKNVVKAWGLAVG